MIQSSEQGPHIAAAILAAGSSRRMSASSGHELNKLLCRINGVSLLRRSCETVLATRSLARIVVILGHQANRLQDELSELDVETQVNSQHLEGQASSVGLATRHVAADAAIDGLLFVPADQPGLDSSTISSLCERFAAERHRQPAPVVAPRFEGRRGAPVLFPRRLFAKLQQLNGDEGGRKLLDDEVPSWVELDSGLPLEDADTPEQFLTLCRRLGATPDLLGATL